MLIPLTSLKSTAADTPQPGEQMASEIQDEDGNVLYRAIYDLVETAPPKGVSGIGLATKLASEEFPSPEFKAAQAAPAPAPGVDAKTAMEAVRLAWDIIKDNRAITDLKGASTAILNPRNMNPFDYVGAKTGQTKARYWWGYNWPFKKWKAFEVWVRLCGTYGATAPKDVPNGKYLPSVYVDFPKAPWAEWGLRMNGNVMVTPPSNVGTQDNGIAFCELITTVTVSSPVDPSRPQPFKFRAYGDRGFVPV